jgi:hypothetical protein
MRVDPSIPIRSLTRLLCGICPGQVLYEPCLPVIWATQLLYGSVGLFVLANSLQMFAVSVRSPSRLLCLRTGPSSAVSG